MKPILDAIAGTNSGIYNDFKKRPIPKKCVLDKFKLYYEEVR